jgi:ATP-dependent helicase/nuclease subunit A
MRDGFDGMLSEIGRELARCDLLYSFRSAAPILRLVDAVFAGPAGKGLAARVEHKAFDPAAPGRVELWPFLEKPERQDEPPWDQPLDMPAANDPVQVLARRVAATIRGWLDSGRALPGARDGRAVRPGDVLILVQRRGSVFDAVIRELKRARVPVAGADVLRIGAELAVKDLLAALRVAATPADDLSLAALLRSPIGGWSEAQLFRLAHPRQDAHALGGAERGRARALHPRGAARPARPGRLPSALRAAATPAPAPRRAPPSDRALGLEAEDGIDALLDQALAYESVEPPTLTGFLAWIDRDEVTVKRRMEEAATKSG